MKLPTLKLSHKGLLIVVLPAIMQFLLYAELKHEIDAVQLQVEAQQYSRDVQVHVNSLILEASKLFEAYVNLWVVHNNKLAARTDPLRQTVQNELEALVMTLRSHPEDLQMATEIQQRGDAFLQEIAAVRLTLGKSDKPLTMFDALEMHSGFGSATRSLQDCLLRLGSQHIWRARQAQDAEHTARRQLLMFSDLALGVTLAMALGAALWFVHGTVSSLETLKRNAQRLANGEELLPPIKADEEIASVDQQFHEMARKLNEASAQLDESYKRLQAVIDTVPMAVIICDDAENIESINRAGTVLFGYKLDQAKGLSVSRLFEQSKPLAKWLDECRERPLHLEGTTKDAELVPVEVTVLRFQSPVGPRFLLAVMDITERYKIEKMKRDFVAMVSHDIRAPLSSISSYLELIKDSPADDSNDRLRGDRIDAAQQCADRLLALVMRLLDLERLDSGIFNFDLRNFDIAEAIDSAWQVTRPPGKNIGWHAPDNQIQVFGDRSSVEQILQNLLSNAIKYSPDGTEIRCAVSRQDDMVKVCVIDQGSGVPARYKETIFERFKQTPQSRGRKDGTGLGLALCKSTVQALGGAIGVQDNPGGGSIFWFTLPAAEANRLTDRIDSQRSEVCG